MLGDRAVGLAKREGGENVQRSILLDKSFHNVTESGLASRGGQRNHSDNVMYTGKTTSSFTKFVDLIALTPHILGYYLNGNHRDAT